MSEYTGEQLKEAHFALSSTLQKCEKVMDGKRLPKPQQTLLERRIRALRLSLELIEKEMKDGAVL